MGHWHRILWLSLLVLSCNKAFYGDYFPLKEGKWWKYEKKGSVLRIEVWSEQDSIYQVLFGDEFREFVKLRDAVLEKKEIRFFHEGDVYNAGTCTFTFLRLPLMDEDRWKEEISLNVGYPPVPFTLERESQILWVGEFNGYNDVYMLVITERESLPSSTEERHDTLYLAPDVGIVEFNGWGLTEWGD